MSLQHLHTQRELSVGSADSASCMLLAVNNLASGTVGQMQLPTAHASCAALQLPLSRLQSRTLLLHHTLLLFTRMSDSPTQHTGGELVDSENEQPCTSPWPHLLMMLLVIH